MFSLVFAAICFGTLVQGMPNLVDLATQLNATKFVAFLQQAGLTDSIKTGGNVHSLYVYMHRKESIFLFNDALNTFYVRLYDVRHKAKDHSDSERGNQLLFPISSKGSFICIILQTG